MREEWNIHPQKKNHGMVDFFPSSRFKLASFSFFFREVWWRCGGKTKKVRFRIGDRNHEKTMVIISRRNIWFVTTENERKVGSYGQKSGRKKPRRTNSGLGPMMGLESCVKLTPWKVIFIGGKYIIPQLNAMVNWQPVTELVGTPLKVQV